MRPPLWRRLLRGGWLVVVLIGVVAALAANADGVGSALRGLSPGWLVASGLAVLVGVLGSGMLWRSLLGASGCPLPVPAAARVFFVGQLAKYLPGSVWPLLSQVEYGRDYAVPPAATVTALVLFHWVQLLTAAVTAALLLPLSGLVPAYWALLAVPCALLLLAQPQAWAIGLGLRLLRRPPLAAAPDGRSAARACGWGLVMWVAWGAHLWLLLTGLDVDVSTVSATGSFAAAWALGFVVLVAPAGVGVREAVLVGLLLPGAAAPVAVTAALLSRLLFTLADVGCAGLGLLAGRTGRSAFAGPPAAEPPRPG